MVHLTFDELLEAFEALPVERQESISGIIRNRLRDKRRAEIAENASDAHHLLRAGKLPVGTVEEMVADVLRGDG